MLKNSNMYSVHIYNYTRFIMLIDFQNIKNRKNCKKKCYLVKWYMKISNYDIKRLRTAADLHGFDGFVWQNI